MVSCILFILFFTVNLFGLYNEAEIKLFSIGRNYYLPIMNEALLGIGWGLNEQSMVPVSGGSSN